MLQALCIGTSVDKQNNIFIIKNTQIIVHLSVYYIFFIKCNDST